MEKVGMTGAIENVAESAATIYYLLPTTEGRTRGTKTDDAENRNKQWIECQNERPLLFIPRVLLGVRIDLNWIEYNWTIEQQLISLFFFFLCIYLYIINIPSFRWAKILAVVLAAEGCWRATHASAVHAHKEEKRKAETWRKIFTRKETRKRL